MPSSKKQMRRLVMLVSELKQNNYPNTTSFAKKLRKKDLDENINIACSSKTIQRDIKVLKEEYGAPIEFDTVQRGYYLKHHGWDFQCPVFEEHDLVAAILGAKLAEALFPNPLKSEVRDATDNLLTENNPEILDSATINALVIATGLKVVINSGVFKNVFDAWILRRTLKILYKSSTGKITERTIEPHVLAYHNASWFLKGKCLLRNSIRTFAVHRIKKAEIEEEKFQVDFDLVKEVQEGFLFSYKRIKNIRVKCSASLAPYIIDSPIHSGQRVKMYSDDSFLLTLPEATEYDIISWILTKGGQAELLSPLYLRKKIAETARGILNLHL